MSTQHRQPHIQYLNPHNLTSEASEMAESSDKDIIYIMVLSAVCMIKISSMIFILMVGCNG